MAGKLVEESKKARLAFYDNKRKEREKKDKTVSRIMLTPTGGSAFTLEGDPVTIAVYLTTQTPKSTTSQTAEFAGLSSNAVPAAGFLADAEGLEFDAWIALEEEHNIDSATDLKTNADGYKATATLTKDHKLALTSEPFYLDSGTMTHISPNQSDFISLTPIPVRQIRGVGGASIAAIGIGTIRVHVTGGMYIDLENALYIPKSTVRLLSISKMTRKHRMSAMFDDTRVSLTKKLSGATMATGTLL